MNRPGTAPPPRLTAADWLPWLAARIRQPTALVMLLAVVQMLLWGVLAARFIAGPQDDSLEQVLLAQEFRLAYGKHPPLPTWLLYAVNQVFGASIGATFVLGASCSIVTLLILYAWAKTLIGAPRAAVVALLASTVEFMNAGTTYFNHNTVQLPFAVLTIVLFHRALTKMRWRDWVLFGVGAGLMMLAKFSAVVLFVSFAGYLAWTGRLRDLPTLRGALVALFVCAAVIAPQLSAAAVDAATPGRYAEQSLFPPQFNRLERLKTVWNFATSHIAKVAPALLLFWWLQRRAPASAPAAQRPVALGPFLTIVGFGPIVLTLSVATIVGAWLLVGWGTTFHVLLTFWLVAASPWAIDATPRVLRLAAALCIAVQAALWAVVAANGGTLPNLRRWTQHRLPPAPPQLAQVVQAAWAERSAAPLRFVLTDFRTGAGLAVQFRGEPLVINANRKSFSTLLPASTLAACGAVIVSGRAADSPPTSPLDAMLDATAPFVSAEVKTAEGERSTYLIGVRPPESNARCDAVR